MIHQHLIYFFVQRLKRLASQIFFERKIVLAAAKIIYIDTYTIFFNALSYGHSVKGNNQDLERTGPIASSVIK